MAHHKVKKGRRKLTIHGGFKAMEHKKEKRKRK